jgi:GDP-4-dehydro-6-deoxy-D-mannose reductase
MGSLVITGLNGWSGRHSAASILRDEKMRVIGIDRGCEVHESLRPFADRVRCHGCDITQEGDVLSTLLERERVDGILHLAGLTVSDDWSALVRVNVHGTVNLLKAVLKLRKAGWGDPPILIVSSSAVYGQTAPEDSPISEECPLQPLTPYGASKAAQEFAAHRFFRTEGLRVLRVRTFNLVGPGQVPDLVCSSIARQIAQAELREGVAVVKLGRLDTERDFIDIRDAVSLYLKTLDVGLPGDVYNCGSGTAHSIGQVVDVFRGLTPVEVKVEQRADVFRKVDILSQRADLTKVFRVTGWKPSIPSADSLRDLLNEWRSRVK